MNCCKCGAKITSDAMYCTHCGSKQATGSSVSGNNWFSPANDLDDSPIVAPKRTPPTESVATGSSVKPVEGTSSTLETHRKAPTISYGKPTDHEQLLPTNAAEAVKPTSKPIFSKANGGIPSKAWGKYAIAAIVIVIIIVAVVLSNNQGTYWREDSGITKNEGNYYSVEQARQLIVEEGYKLGEDIKIQSEDGSFFYKVNLAKEEFDFLTLSGQIEFTAEYDAGRWITCISPKVNYDWKLSGSWFAETENYYVYMDIKSYTGSNLRLVLEAQYDSTEGGKGSYKERDQMVTLKFVDDGCQRGKGIYDVYLYCEVSGGYPIFQLRIDKDTMTIWQLYDSYRAELVPN